MIKWLAICALTLTASACGPAHDSNHSEVSAFLSGWIPGSPYMLRPGDTIAVCDTGVKAGVRDYVMKAARIWLNAGGRDERLQITAGCQGTRVIQLVKAPPNVNYYGQAHPLRGNVHRLDVPPQWANYWTANHEVGHVFAFAHIFNGTVSIMNSEQNGRYMNNGELSDYDFSEVRRMLALSRFKEVNNLWKQGARNISEQ